MGHPVDNANHISLSTDPCTAVAASSSSASTPSPSTIKTGALTQPRVKVAVLVWPVAPGVVTAAWFIAAWGTNRATN